MEHLVFNWLVEITFKASLVVVLTLVLDGMIRRFSAAQRATIWTMAFVVVASLPLAQLVPSPIALELPDFNSVGEMQEPIEMTVPAALPGGSPLSSTKAMGSVESDSVIAAAPLSLESFLLLLWVFGVGVGLLSLTRNVMRTRWVIAGASACDDECWRLAQQQYPELKKVRLLVAPDSPTPFVHGFFQPVLVLTESPSTVSPEEWRFIIAHEAAHVLRRDWPVRLFVQILGVLHWFNPLVQVGVKRLILMQEKACDDCVLRDGHPAAAYGSVLLHFARRVHGSTVLPQLMMATPSTLKQRIQSMLDTTINRNTLTASFRAFTLGGAVLVLLLIGCASRGSEVELVPQNAVAEPQEEVTAYARAQQIVIPDVRFDAVLVPEALETLGRLSKEYDALGEGINLLFNVTDVANETARLSLHAVNMNIFQILESIAQATAFKAIPISGGILVTDDPEQRTVSIRSMVIEGDAIEINGKRLEFDFGAPIRGNTLSAYGSLVFTGALDIRLGGRVVQQPTLKMGLGNKGFSEIKTGREVIVQGETVLVGTVLRAKVMRSGDKYLLLVESELRDLDALGRVASSEIRTEVILATNQTLFLGGIQYQGEDGIRQKAFVVSIEEH